MRVGDFQFNLLFTQISPKKPKPQPRLIFEIILS